MKYSLILPYTDSVGRPEAFLRAAESLVHYYAKRRDLQIVVIIDQRGGVPSEALDLLWPHFEVRVEYAQRWTRNSAAAINQGVACSSGDFIILSSPEVMHNVDCLSEFDYRHQTTPDAYHVMSCGGAGPDGKFKEWYQHSVYNARKLHFLSSMSRNTWCNIGGFDERYCFGSCYEDNDFVMRVTKAGVVTYQWDYDEEPGAHCVHLHHEKTYLADGTSLWETNRKLYIQTWETPHA